MDDGQTDGRMKCGVAELVPGSLRKPYSLSSPLYHLRLQITVKIESTFFFFLSEISFQVLRYHNSD